MAGLWRLEYEGAFYHVTARENGRQAIYFAHMRKNSASFPFDERESRRLRPMKAEEFDKKFDKGEISPSISTSRRQDIQGENNGEATWISPSG